ncbi:hypothetical protein QTO34_002214 [Cnephaeus nilssonii]|uniref:Uncharacterized protein n=1 Tax=Cnephaeus nilssonii TaxID=3371016 RepID=A0AA40HV71_CNENI|nr:hypothetical protein QTO34_002214 [Eptesicus nilssonii]
MASGSNCCRGECRAGTSMLLQMVRVPSFLQHRSSYNYLYRMKALDAICASEIPFHAEGPASLFLNGQEFSLLPARTLKH